MRVLISGASGLIGQALTRALVAAGHQVVALVRRAPREGEVQWNPGEPLDPAKLADCDAVVHLAGKNIAGRWTEKFKEEVCDSRVQGTRTLATAAAESYRRSGKPGVFLSASAIGYYGDRGEELLTESSSAGEGFLAEVSQQWEAATAPASEAGVRVVNLRIGVVLAHGGGALPPLLLPFRLGLGGRMGSGEQYWSWIGLDDVVGAIQFALGERQPARPGEPGRVPQPARNRSSFARWAKCCTGQRFFLCRHGWRASLSARWQMQRFLARRAWSRRSYRPQDTASVHPELGGAIRAALCNAPDKILHNRNPHARRAVLRHPGPFCEMSLPGIAGRKRP